MSKAEEARLAGLHEKMNKYLAEFATSNYNRKANDLGKEMIKFLADNPDAIDTYPDISNFIDGLGSQWVFNQNPKVNLFGLEALILCAEAMQAKYKAYCATVFHHVIPKMGDTKEYLREKAREYYLKTVEVGAFNPNHLIEKMIPLLSNKNANMSLEAQRTILETLNMCKSKKLVGSILVDLLKAEIACLNTNIRDDAAIIILDMAERLGKARVLEILQKGCSGVTSHHHKKLQTLIDDIRALQIEQHASGGAQSIDDEDEPDLSISSKPKKVTTVAKPKQKTTLATGTATGTGRSMSKPGGALRPTKIGEGDKYALHSGPAGEADENWFLTAFSDVPELNVLSKREFDSLTQKIIEDLKSNPEFWEKKVEAQKKLRSVVLNLKVYEEEVAAFIKSISLLIMANLKDLRSQVVRETCLTFAFLCKELKNKVDAHTCELMLQQLMTNLMSSARVVVSASFIAMKFMFTYVTHSRMINTLVQIIINTKSRDIRSAGCELLGLILHTWPVNRLEQQIPALQDGIKKGMTENSSTEGRMAARKAFWAFRAYFPDQGDALLASLDMISKRNIMSVQDQCEKAPPSPVPKPKALSARPSVTRQASAETVSRKYTPPANMRSNSAIDLQAVQRAKVRQQYAALARQKVGSGASLPRPKKLDPPGGSGPMSSSFGAERTGRTRSRVSGVSHSQPSSRSGSPSSRLGYQSYSSQENSLVYQARRNIPRSQGTSRETSPNRFGSKSSLNILLGPKRRHGERPPIQPSRPVMAQKMLAQSLEAENVPLASELYDGDNSDSLGHKVSPRKTSYRPFEDHSDDSDASSLCSERSFDSYRRTSDSYSWSGSQQRLYRDVWDTGAKDIIEVITNCESTHWADRKEGLVQLQSYLQANNVLNAAELKRVTEVFTRMFSDNHTKVFSLFLDTLNELILVHRTDLNSWLYVLLTRLLNKMGADLLGSIQNKILKSLDTIRESFPPDLQMSSVLRFLTDPTQTPNLRVKIAALNFITKVAPMTEPGQAFPPYVPGSSRDSVQAALHKMIGWTMGDFIKQGNELRRAAQEAIMALFNLNTPQITLRMAGLPQEYQEAASTLLKGRVRRGSTAAGSPPSPSREFQRVASPSSHRRSGDHADPDEIYQSLRKTTAEIQNYTYEAGSEKPPDKDNTTSKDSGISQLSGTEALEEAMEELSLQSSSSSNATTNTLTNRVLTVRDCNGIDTTDNSHPEGGAVDEQEALRKIVEALGPPDSDNGENISIQSDSEKRASLTQLTRLIRDSSVSLLQENFKALLRILLGNLMLDNTRDIQTRILVLTALTELIKKRAMNEFFNHFVELLILRVLNCYKDNSKEVVRAAEMCANTIATNLSPSLVIRVLAPLIQTGEYPLNLAAVKMLTRLIDAFGRDPVFDYLPDLMPGLIQAYDNHESSVRKSAVFCMVSLHAAIGEEELKPHLTALNGSKLKLLHLYIRRSQQGSSAPTSPRNHPPSSS